MSQSHAVNDALLPSLGGQEYFISGIALWEWWQWARQAAIVHHIPPNEVDWLLQALTDLDRLSLRLGSFRHQPQLRLKVAPEQLKVLWQQRLQQRVPVQYLAGRTSWREFSLLVSPAVLIPRPETELLIDLAIEAEREGEVERRERGEIPESVLRLAHWADLGTGSGAIALGLATAFPAAQIHAVDISGEALTIAQANAMAYQLSDRICFYQGSWLEPLVDRRRQLQGILANPPYIPTQQVKELQPEVRQHEPHLALDGGSDGLDWIRHLVAAAPDYLRSGGIWLIEMMAGQADAVTRLLAENGNYHQIQIHSDLAGLERFAFARRL